MVGTSVGQTVRIHAEATYISMGQSQSVLCASASSPVEIGKIIESL